MPKQPRKWFTHILSFLDRYFAIRERGLSWLMRRYGRDLPASRRPRRQLEIEVLEDRQMLSVTPQATPYLMPVGEANIDLNAGAARLTQNLNLDVSNGTDNGAGLSALDYNSSTVSVRPVLTISVPTDPALTVPLSIVATLTFNGNTQSPVSFSIPGGHSAGDTYTLGLQVASPLSSTGLDSWNISVVVVYSLSNHPTTTYTGSTPVVVRDSATAPYGAGWSLDAVDQLYTVSGGVLWVAGSGDTEFFASAGGGAYTSPAGDFGTLVLSGGVYTYTAIDQTVSHFNSSGQLTSRVDPDGNSWTFSYDGSGRVSQIQAPDGSITSMTYGTNSQLSMIYEPGTRSLGFTESSGNLTQIVDVDTTTRTLSYDSQHHVTSDAWSPYSSTFDYDSGNALLIEAGESGTIDYHIMPAAHEGIGTLAMPAPVIGEAWDYDGNNHTTSYSLDSAAQLTEEVQPGGLSQSWTRDAQEQVTVYTDPRGEATSNTYYYGGYDSTLHAGNGDLTKTVFPDGSSNTFQYDSLHNLTEFVNGDGNIMSNTFSGSDLTRSISGYGTAAASTINQTWSSGLLQTETDGDGNVISDGYNSSRQMTATLTTDPGSNIVDDESFTYDSNGFQATNVIGVGGGSPQTTSTTFDKKGQLLTQTNPAGDSITNTYLPAGFLATTIDGNGVEESLSYNTAAEVLSDYADSNQIPFELTANTFDGAGNLLTTTDPVGNYVSNSYDSDNRLTKALSFDSGGTQIGSMSYTYDNDSNVLTTTDGVGNVVSDSYDSMNRLLSEIDKDSGGTVVSSMAQTYDNDSNTLTSTDGDGNIVSSTYDALDRLTVQIVKDSGGSTVSSLSNDYDADSNVIRSTSGDGNVTSDTFDGLNRVLVETVKDNGGNLVSSMAQTYDRDFNCAGRNCGRNCCQIAAVWILAC